MFCASQEVDEEGIEAADRACNGEDDDLDCPVKRTKFSEGEARCWGRVRKEMDERRRLDAEVQERVGGRVEEGPEGRGDDGRRWALEVRVGG